MVKLYVSNSFHESYCYFYVKDSYNTEGMTADDILKSLDYMVYSNGDDARYAKRKLKEIRNELCLGGKGCKCVNRAYEAGYSWGK
jgi:hypothetical protein